MSTPTPAAYAAEMLAMAELLEREAAYYGPAAAKHGTAISAALRASAAAPPDCEDAFRYRLCLLMDWHPRRDRRDLDGAVARAAAKAAVPA